MKENKFVSFIAAIIFIVCLLICGIIIYDVNSVDKSEDIADTPIVEEPIVNDEHEYEIFSKTNVDWIKERVGFEKDLSCLHCMSFVYDDISVSEDLKDLFIVPEERETSVELVIFCCYTDGSDNELVLTLSYIVEKDLLDANSIIDSARAAYNPAFVNVEISYLFRQGYKERVEELKETRSINNTSKGYLSVIGRYVEAIDGNDKYTFKVLDVLENFIVRLSYASLSSEDTYILGDQIIELNVHTIKARTSVQKTLAMSTFDEKANVYDWTFSYSSTLPNAKVESVKCDSLEFDGVLLSVDGDS